MPRLLAHLAGRGSPLVAAVVGAGIAVRLARTWPGDRAVERALKRRKRHRAFCPLCAADAAPSGVGGGGGLTMDRRPRGPPGRHRAGPPTAHRVEQRFHEGAYDHAAHHPR